MKTFLITILALTFFSGCGDDSGADITTPNTPDSEVTEISNADKLLENPHFLIYNDNCTQDSNLSLCGYVAPENPDAPPTLPATEFMNICEDKVYCK